MFSCGKCPKSFNYKQNMQRHLKEVHYGKKRSQHVNTPALQHVNTSRIDYQSQQPLQYIQPTA